MRSGHCSVLLLILSDLINIRKQKSVTPTLSTIDRNIYELAAERLKFDNTNETNRQAYSAINDSLIIIPSLNASIPLRTATTQYMENTR